MLTCSRLELLLETVWQTRADGCEPAAHLTALLVWTELDNMGLDDPTATRLSFQPRLRYLDVVAWQEEKCYGGIIKHIQGPSVLILMC